MGWIKSENEKPKLGQTVVARLHGPILRDVKMGTCQIMTISDEGNIGQIDEWFPIEPRLK